MVSLEQVSTITVTLPPPESDSTLSSNQKLNNLRNLEYRKLYIFIQQQTSTSTDSKSSNGILVKDSKYNYLTATVMNIFSDDLKILNCPISCRHHLRQTTTKRSIGEWSISHNRKRSNVEMGGDLLTSPK